MKKDNESKPPTYCFNLFFIIIVFFGGFSF